MKLYEGKDLSLVDKDGNPLRLIMAENDLERKVCQSLVELCAQNDNISNVEVWPVLNINDSVDFVFIPIEIGK